MLRRSSRLQEVGYYTEAGTPYICYKHISYRKSFGRMKHQNRVRHDPVENQGNEDLLQEDVQNIAETQAPQTTLCLRINSIFSLLILLGFGITNYIEMQRHMQDFQQELHSLRHEMNMFIPESNKWPNFALDSQGARVLYHRSSNTYWPKEYMGIVWNMIFNRWYSYESQTQVIQGHSSLSPGQCWPFSGEQGHLFICLSHPVAITHVTLGHIRKSQSPNGYIASAPRKFSIYGMMTTDDKETHLGTLVYDQDGASFQTFKLPDPDKGVFRYVKLQVESNWGNEDYTCLYSFRVHGKLPHLTALSLSLAGALQKEKEEPHIYFK